MWLNEKGIIPSNEDSILTNVIATGEWTKHLPYDRHPPSFPNIVPEKRTVCRPSGGQQILDLRSGSLFP
jgi:hypothetical protein